MRTQFHRPPPPVTSVAGRTGAITLTVPDIGGAAATAGAHFTGPILTEAGSAAAPVLARNGDSNTGLLFPAADTLAIATGGAERLRVASGGNVGINVANPAYRLVVSNQTTPPPAFTGAFVQFAGNDGNNTVMVIDQFGSAGSPSLVLRRARNSAAAPAAVAAAEVIGQLGATGHGATAYAPAVRASINFVAAETWTDTAQGTHLSFQTTPTGSTGRTERLRIAADGTISMGGGNVTVLTATGHPQLRSYTVATLPTANPAGQLVFVSNGADNRRLALSTGTGWVFPDGAAVA